MNTNEKNIIEVTSLIKKFDDFTAVDKVNFHVREGEIFSFLGPNGAGKTTTIKMLTTLLKPTSGKILLNGTDPVENQGEARRSFGIVFQDPSLDEDLTAFENLEFHGILYNVPKKERRKKINDLLKFVQLDERANDLVKEFSGGMKRRLEIARGLIHEPKILFLDEPTLGLDPQTRIHIWDYIKELNKKNGMTVFFTTHYIEEAEKMSDRSAIIDKGKIIKEGKPDNLKKETDTKTLEDAFLSLTGREIRQDEATGADRMRQARKMWQK